jgi:metal-sulfur cluster biosynthetic enzyme
MTSFLSETEIRRVIEQVRHPAIDHTLMDLGMIKDVGIEGEKVTLTFVFPFPGIPIKDRLIDSVRLPLINLGAEVEIVTTVMNQEELNKFLAMEEDGWKGGI